ncbi:SAM-dependent methyltransferase [Phenylobacterium immobile]|uniref:SAM-dependent methyltransferase n=1 Tax=Phenylobacterium immobile TaxID=21 RepID=UPI000ACB9CC7|nr:cyclopropane-fatty-acyl-phospholipid synthase family protein [Phenylobacterium immobile]
MSLAQDNSIGGRARFDGAPAAFRAIIQSLSQNWRIGSLSFVSPRGEAFRLEGQRAGPHGSLILRDYRTTRRVLVAGDIGFAEGYLAGEWDSPDLAALLEALSLNFDEIKQVTLGNPLTRLIQRIGHALRGNSRAGSRRNIQVHYDLGNDFYAAWLDPSMTYSSALYDGVDASLETAQTRKYEVLARGMGLQAGHSVLEIGCGWGGFAEFAAREVGAQVSGVTISREQYDFARKRLFEAGLAERADIQLIDYRDVRGTYDRVASIEMFEAVGEKYWPIYFETIRDRLKDDGRAGLQIITIRDDLFEEYRSRSDFIQKYVFPGGMLPSQSRLASEIAAQGLVCDGALHFGQDYARTLAAWAQGFEAAWDEIKHQGFDARFHRLWRFYLAYCEAGFRSRRTDVVQLNLAKA